MIKTIIKRDGSREPFSAKKVNNWVQWSAAKRVDWSTVVMEVCSQLPDETTSSDLQKALIDKCLERRDWGYMLMAGRLYAPTLHKDVYPSGIPTVKELHQKLIGLKLMVDLGYSDEEYEAIQTLIDHSRDYNTPHFSIKYILEKYSIQNRVKNEFYETQQFTYMRLAMTTASQDPVEGRIEKVKKFYDMLSLKKVSSPTPFFVNMGTPLKGYASCCLIAAGDNVDSIGIADWISYRMTASSAGIGTNYMVRSLGDPVRNGSIKHNGKLPYFRSMAHSVKANMQAGRGGACTTYYNAFDPEAETISQLRNPRSPTNKRIRELHYALMTNKFFAEKVAKDEQAFSFNMFTAPELHEAFYSGDIENFKAIYNKLENDPTFKKEYFSPRELIVRSFTEAYETGVAYLANMDEINRHTPFKEPIHSSNLCLEITEPTRPYYDMTDLYSDSDVGYVVFESDDGDERYRMTWSQRVEVVRDGVTKVTFAGDLVKGDSFYANGRLLTLGERIAFKEEPEVAMCSLGAINVAEVKSDKEYEEACYTALKMIDYAILNSEHALPHIGFTSRQRMSAGVGIMGLATLMAEYQLRYDTPDGLKFMHRVAERHMYFMIKASIRISKERGVAPWIHKTKWVDGWVPTKTYNRNVDALGEFNNEYDWDALSEEIKLNGGIAHSVLVAFMPGESSSKALGQPNSIYPVRETVMLKTDNATTIEWVAPENDNPYYAYQSAWDVTPENAIQMYAVFQKWTDQAISADLWDEILGDDKIPSTVLIKQYLMMIKNGVKTRYYTNSQTSGQTKNRPEPKATCGGGGCDV